MSWDLHQGWGLQSLLELLGDSGHCYISQFPEKHCINMWAPNADSSPRETSACGDCTHHTPPLESSEDFISVPHGESKGKVPRPLLLRGDGKTGRERGGEDGSRLRQTDVTHGLKNHSEEVVKVSPMPLQSQSGPGLPRAGTLGHVELKAKTQPFLSLPLRPPQVSQELTPLATTACGHTGFFP